MRKGGLPEADFMEKELQRTYQIIRRLETGGEELIASRDDFAEAQQLAATLSDVLPGDFFVRRYQSPSRSESGEAPRSKPD